MRFLLDAQLPRRLARRLAELGHDSLHTLDLPDGNRTRDSRICSIADSDRRFVVTKDRDFVDTFILRRAPKRLLFVSSGNINNDELIALFVRRLSEIEAAAQSSPFLELSRNSLIIRE